MQTQSLSRVRAKSLYQAMRRRRLMWPLGKRGRTEWRENFDELDCHERDSPHVDAVLDFYCERGIGAVFLPMVGNARHFNRHFGTFRAAAEEFRCHELIYFDDVMECEIIQIDAAVPEQRDYARVLQRLVQQASFVRDLAEGRATLSIRPEHFYHDLRTMIPPKALKLKRHMREVARELVPLNREAIAQSIGRGPTFRYAYDQLETSEKFVTAFDRAMNL